MKRISFYNQKYYEIGGYGYANEDRSDHKRILELLKTKDSDKVLEIGCGLGVLLKKIPAQKKIGTETNYYAIKRSRKRGLSVIKNDVEKGLPFPNFSFDIIIMNEVISHLQKPELALKECFRLLKPKGKLVATAPVRSRFFHNISETHLHEMGIRELRDLVQNNGFRIITHEVVGISFLYPMLENVFFKPFRLLRYLFIKNQKAAKTVSMIDSCHKLVDKTFLKPLDQYRKYFLKLGLQQLILAKKS